MTYCPCTGHVVLKTAGIVLSVKCVSLKHWKPSDFFVVLETYKEKPRNRCVKPFVGPSLKNKRIIELPQN